MGVQNLDHDTSISHFSIPVTQNFKQDCWKNDILGGKNYCTDFSSPSRNQNNHNDEVSNGKFESVRLEKA
jgi:hypothetical protein